VLYLERVAIAAASWYKDLACIVIEYSLLTNFAFIIKINAKTTLRIDKENFDLTFK